jgi:hypothetical protein
LAPAAVKTIDGNAVISVMFHIQGTAFAPRFCAHSEATTNTTLQFPHLFGYCFLTACVTIKAALAVIFTIYLAVYVGHEIPRMLYSLLLQNTHGG